MRVFFVRNKNKFPVACVASEVTKKGDTEIVRFSMSSYNPKDTFDRERAKEIAKHRLAKYMSLAPEIENTQLTSSETYAPLEVEKYSGTVPRAGNVKTHIMQLIEVNTNLSYTVRKAALLWLSRDEVRV
jgi:hypothetical protein